METRPKLKLSLTLADKILEGFGWLAVVASWILAIFVYPQLPERIPTHFGISGAADAFGPKSEILSLPIIATILFIALSIIIRFPHQFNYLCAITESNALKQYTFATRLVRFLKFSVVVIFLAIFALSSLTALRKASGLGVWFLPATTAFVFVPLVFYMVKSKKAS